MSRTWEAVDGWACSECGQVILGSIDATIDAAHVCGPRLGSLSKYDPDELNKIAAIVTGASAPRHPLFSVRYGIAAALLDSDWLRDVKDQAVREAR